MDKYLSSMFYMRGDSLSIKKILLFSLLVFLIPFIIVNIFIRDDEITFNFNSNSIVRVYREDTGNVERVPIEQYVIGVLAGEVPITFDKEALKAQAVASRTYVMYHIQRSKDKDYDVVDTVANQVFKSEEDLKDKWKDKYLENINKIKEVVLATSGEYLTYDKKVIESFFFSTSVGYTENSEDVFSEALPYLRSVESKWDEISPVYEDSVEFTKLEFFSQLGLAYTDTLNIEVVEKTKTGRVKKIKINDKEFTGKEVCGKLKLRSTCFSIKEENGMIKIDTKGFGHGVGMSQYGAQGMALEGYKYDEILKYYYQGVSIDKF